LVLGGIGARHVKVVLYRDWSTGSAEMIAGCR